MRLSAVGLAAFLALAGSAEAAPPPLRGVNLSGAELNADAPSSRINFDYTYPKVSELAEAAQNGMSAIRLPVAWERLQPTLGAGLDPGELARLRQTLDAAQARHLVVIVDLHGYGHYRGTAIGSAQVPTAAFAQFWEAMAVSFRDSPAVVFGLMNEPHGIEATTWAASAQAALNAIRRAGFRGLVLVPGTGWDGAHNFVSGAGYGIPNAAVLGKLVDPGHDMAIEMHQYLDADFSGTHPDCPWAARTAELFGAATDWLRRNRLRGFLGEIGVSDRPECLAGLDAALSFLDRNGDAWLGWSYWAAGPWWPQDYMFSVEPAPDRRERPQMTVLRRHVTPLKAPER